MEATAKAAIVIEVEKMGCEVVERETLSGHGQAPERGCHPIAHHDRTVKTFQDALEVQGQMWMSGLRFGIRWKLMGHHGIRSVRPCKFESPATLYTAGRGTS